MVNRALSCVLLSGLLIASTASMAATMECKDRVQREASVTQLTSDIDWFLSIVEDVPAGVAQQFRAVDITDRRAFQTAISHPLWQASVIRDRAADIKDSLALILSQTSDWRIKRAIMALGYSVSLTEELSAYADRNPGRRIVDTQKWAFNSRIIPLQLQRFAICLVDNRVN